MITLIGRIIYLVSIFIEKLFPEPLKVFCCFIEKLDCETRNNVYVGVTAILIAIVIFIVEITSKDNKNETYKRFILEKTNILEQVRNMIIIMASIWGVEVIRPQMGIIVYIFAQLAIDIFIVFSMIETFKVFSEAIKLNTNKKYFYKELKTYIHEKIKENVKLKEKAKLNISKKNEAFKKFCENSKIFKQYEYFLGDDYKELEATKKGNIYDFDYNMLNKIEESLLPKMSNNSDKEIEEKELNKKPEIYICKSIGDKCGEGTIIAYYKNIEKEQINLINQAIVMNNKDYIDYNSEIAQIIDDVFTMEDQDLSKKENEERIADFYDYICVNKYEDEIIMFFDKIVNILRDDSKNINDNIRMAEFLQKILENSLNNDRYEEYKRISFYITNLYIIRMNFQGANTKEIAYNYSNNIFLYNRFLVKRKKQYIYYEIVVASLLNIIKEYIKLKDFEGIFVFFDNIYFDKINYFNRKELSNCEIIDFQFVIAIVYFILYMLREEKKKHEENIDDELIFYISKLIKILNEKNLCIKDMWYIITLFKKYSPENNEIMRVIESADFYNESHRYKNTWSDDSIDMNEVLKSCIYMFEIGYVDLEEIENKDIREEDKYKYERLLDTLKSESFKALEERYRYKEEYKEKAKRLVGEVIKKIVEKEEKDASEPELDVAKIDDFKNIVSKEANEKSEIEKLLDRLGKIRESSEKLSSLFGTQQLIPRKLFIDDEINRRFIAKNIGQSLRMGIERKIIEYIEKVSNISKITLEEEIENKIDINEYILIKNPWKVYDSKYNFSGNYLEIDGKKIATIDSVNVENFILINKKALPTIELCEFNDTYKENKNNMYVEIEDCFKNQETREKFIKRNKWLEEKGDDNKQNNYLKTMCLLKVFKSFKIIESDINDSYLISK